MGTVDSGLSLLMALALVGLLVALSRADARRILGRGRNSGGHGGGNNGRRGTGRYPSMTYAFSATTLSVIHLLAGLSGYRLNRAHFSGSRWAQGVVWWEVWVGVAAACVALYFWRRALRDIRSAVLVPELAGHDTAAPPSRRIERR
jgi:hypothetical protein